MGLVNRVIHKGVKYVNYNLPQSSTIFHSDSIITDYLLPVSNICSTLGVFNHSYAVKNLFPVYKNQNEADKSKLLGQIIKIKFPVIVRDIDKRECFHISA